MGTRNLTMVIKNGKPLIAQYGQWDGCPEGQGATALKFLRGTFNEEDFLKGAAKTRFVEDAEIEKAEAETVSVHPKYTMDWWKDFNKQKTAYLLSRDHGAKILFMVQALTWLGGDDSYMLQDHSQFAADSLFCEWAYVIDLDKKTFEVYKGFNNRKLGKTQRFFYLETEDGKHGEVVGSKHHPVRLAKKYKLNALPTEEEFIADFKEKEEE